MGPPPNLSPIRDLARYLILEATTQNKTGDKRGNDQRGGRNVEEQVDRQQGTRITHKGEGSSNDHPCPALKWANRKNLAFIQCYIWGYSHADQEIEADTQS